MTKEEQKYFDGWKANGLAELKRVKAMPKRQREAWKRLVKEQA